MEGLFSATKILKSVQTGVPKTRSLMVAKAGIFGPPYNEDKHPLNGDDAIFQSQMIFVLQEFPHLYNFHLQVTPTKEDQRKYRPGSYDVLHISKRPFAVSFANIFPLLRSFLDVFRGIFEHRADGISIPSAFTLCCWLQIVHLMQGNKCMSRCYSLAKFAVWNIHEQVEKAAKNEHLMSFNKNLGLLPLWKAQAETEPVLNFVEPFVKNPFLSGLLLLDVTLRDLDVSSQAMFTMSNRVKYGCELYHALKSSGQLVQSPIPLLEMLLAKYENFIFQPCSRPAVGEYLRTFFLSGFYTPAVVQRILNTNVPFESPRGTDHTRQKLYTGPQSRLYHLLIREDTACVLARATADGQRRLQQSLTPAELLDEVLEMAVAEMAYGQVGVSMSAVNSAFFNFFHDLSLARVMRRPSAALSHEELDPAMAEAVHAFMVLDSLATDDRATRGFLPEKMVELMNERPEAREATITFLNALFYKHFTDPLEKSNSSWSYEAQQAFASQQAAPLPLPLSTCGAVYSDPFYVLPPDHYRMLHIEFGMVPLSRYMAYG